MKIGLSFCLTLSLISVTQAAPPALDWYKVFGGKYQDSPIALHNYSDNEFILVGYTRSYSQDIPGKFMTNKVYFAKCNMVGEVQAYKIIGDENYTRIPVFSKALKDGNFLIGGSVRPNVFEWQPQQIYLLKLNAAGEVIWEKFYGINDKSSPFAKHKANDQQYTIISYQAFNCYELNDGSIMLLGEVIYHLPQKAIDTKDNNLAEVSKSVVYLAKINPNGTLLWEKIYSLSLSDYPTSFYIGTKSIIISGVSSIKKTFAPGEKIKRPLFYSQPFLLKTDLKGTQLSNKYIDDDAQDDSNLLMVTSNGAIFSLKHTKYNIYLTSISETMDTIWKKSFVYPEHTVQRIIWDSNGYYLLLSHESDITIIKTDDNGEELWSTQFGGYSFDTPSDILTLKDGFIFAGATKSYTVGGGFDFWLMRYKY